MNPIYSSLSAAARLQRRRKNSSALVLTLAFLAILTLLLVAFLARATLERQIAGASAGETKADQIAKTGLDAVVTDFRQEISAGSSVTANTTANPDWPAIYLPLSANTSAPARILPSTEGGSLPNLVRRSMRAVTFTPLLTTLTANNPYTGFPTNNIASATASTDPASNGRYVNSARWNQPQLITSSTLSKFVAPDWVLVTRDGPKAFAGWDPSISVASVTNSNFVVGRYAYAVYDEGGLLDVNVAGRVSGIPTPPLGKTATASMADLTQLTNGVPDCVPNQTAVDALVKWRNASTASTPYNTSTPTDTNSYFGYATSGTNSFTQVQPGDQTLLTRQDLINYISSGTSGITTNALPYLATFTRQVNAPSFYPSLTNFQRNPVANATTSSATSRPLLGASGVVADKSPNRSGTLGQDAVFNPPLADVRFPKAGTFADGMTTVTAGQPMLRTRFALSRLALLTPTATAIKSDTDPIYRYFGIYRSSATENDPNHPGNIITTPWVYDHGEPGGGIYTLSDLQTAFAGGTTPRDPDFFELLQAAIALGSLGRDAGAPIGGGQDVANSPAGNLYPINNATNVGTVDQGVTLHVMQIGANIVDQASPGFDPIVIQDAHSTFQVYGVEDLPYISKVIHFLAADVVGGDTWSGWLAFELWNPSQTNTTAGLGTYPTQFRITGMSPLGHTSQAYMSVKNVGYQCYSFPPIDFNTSESFVQFSLPNAATVQSTFANPTLIDPSNTGLTFTKDTNNLNNLKSITTSDGPHTIAGLYVGNVSDPSFTKASDAMDWEFHPGSTTGNRNKYATVNTGVVSFALQYMTSGPNPHWQTYNLLRDIYGSKNPNSPPQTTYFTAGGGGYAYTKADPRTDRWTCIVDNNAAVAPYPNKYGLTFNFAAGKFFNPVVLGGVWQYMASSGFISGSTSPFYTFNSNNENNSGEHYMDPDGVYRRGDDMYGNTTGDSTASYGFSMNLAKTNNVFVSRPIILHRPFQSVAELGYAFRDVPFKSLDFFTSRSADSALLDVFSAYEEPPVVAGKVDVNTQNAPVLEALLGGACIDELGSGNATSTVLSTAEAKAFATQLVSITSPFVSGYTLHNKSDLVNRVLASTGDTAKANPNTGDTWGSSFVANGSLVQAQQARIKSNRESALRSLSEATASRTWNLMIDIIAQSGRYSPTASSLQSFTIDGEKRYWLHIAIDRYTGKIIAQQLEPVYE